MINLIKLSAISLFACIYLTACSSKEQIKCDASLNKVPMFGRMERCEEQLEFDRKFVAETDKAMSREKSTKYYTEQGWKFLYANKVDTAIMRFNQAWLLDSLGADVYWGFGNALVMQGKFEESLPHLEKSVKINPANAKVLQDLSSAYGNLFFHTRVEKYLYASIEALKDAAKLEPSNAAIYGQITGAYSYFEKKDSAYKYLKITDGLDPKAVNPDIRKLLSSK